MDLSFDDTCFARPDSSVAAPVSEAGLEWLMQSSAFELGAELQDALYRSCR